ncbi:nitroreductase family protein [Penaeicola halotolerans]|uniref:nitroreductase family protein n=1 Tax=Penaeicola halotolerans TaxID=2793196 RepID=UPI001CF9141A|nr:nitroreductase family protein [Penaeicola halotolerans]
MDQSQAEIFTQILSERRSVRIFDESTPYDEDAVKRSLHAATLAPNSSNMQLWEFYRVKNPQIKAQLADYCMGQKAAKTARELILVVARRDLWRKRKDANLAQIRKVYKGRTDKAAKRAEAYYSSLIPKFYVKDYTGLFSLGKRIFAWSVGLFRPMLREVGDVNARISVHKSAGLAAMTLMYALKSEGLDSCPMEGFDSKRVKKLLKLPAGAEINMIIACGPGKPEGIYSERFRVPDEEVIFTID